MDGNSAPKIVPLGGSSNGSGKPGDVPKMDPASEESSQGSLGLPTRTIVGASVGGLGAILVIVFALWVWRKVVAKRQATRSREPFGESNLPMAENETNEESGSAARAARRGTERLRSSFSVLRGGSRS